MIKILSAVAGLVFLLATAANAAERRRAVLPPETPWFHAVTWMRLVPPDLGGGYQLNFLWPIIEENEWKDPMRVKETVTTKAGEVTLFDHESYCFCTPEPGTFEVIFILNSDGSVGNNIKNLPTTCCPGIVEYRFLVSSPSGRHGEVSFQISANDNDNWSFIGGPVTSIEKKPGGGVMLHGVFLTDPTVVSSGGRTDHVVFQAGSVIDISPENLGPLPTFVSACSAVSTTQPNSLSCSIVKVE